MDMPLCLDNANSVAHMPDRRATAEGPSCQKPKTQNASRPGRHQIGMVGEISPRALPDSNFLIDCNVFLQSLDGYPTIKIGAKKTLQMTRKTFFIWSCNGGTR